jgi:AmmeMemoRadiSam system protein B/AmmeMemoRadiSam system protein A
VAGQFYPAEKTQLVAMLKDLFARAAPPQGKGIPLAVIAPHAGYVYSGEVAASAYRRIDPNARFENVFLLGSSHHVAFDGAAVYTRGDFVTPLGKVAVNRELGKNLIKKSDVFLEREDAHRDEHCLEVQLPFLQYHLKRQFKIVPIVLGVQSLATCKKIADVLRPYLTRQNLFVISTDFSHYPAYNDAIVADEASADAILTNSSENLLHTIQENEQKGTPNLVTSMCGWSSVLTLLQMTQGNPNLQYETLRYMNSGDAGMGDKERVVGYYAIALTARGENLGARFSLSVQEKQKLLGIARKSIEEFLKRGDIPEISPDNLNPVLETPCGAFVTLKKHDQLRGCIGRFDASQPLYKVVQQMAVAAATEDYRFSPVQADELKLIEMEISVLTPLRRISSPEEIKMGRDGIYIRKNGRSGTFLPQVATETGWSREEFLGHCAQDKAGIGWDGWKDAELYVYEAYVFSENALQ